MILIAGLVVAVAGPAVAAPPPVGLGTADAFAVLAGSTVTNTGPSVITGDVGVSPGAAIVGFPPGIVTDGTFHASDAVAAQGQADLTTAYNDAAGRTPVTAVGPELGGLTLAAGQYGGGTLQATGTLTLDAQGDPDAVFIFQAASTLITASGSDVALINGAQACNVFWQVGSSATLGTASDFIGNVIALTSITAHTGASVDGRLLARNGAVTLDTNRITRSECDAPSTTTTTTSSSTSSSSSSTSSATTTSASSTTTTGTGSLTSTSDTGTVSASATDRPGTGGPEAGGSGAKLDDSGSAGDSAIGAGPLAVTGTDVTHQTLAGASTLVLGVALLLASGRLRKQHQRRH